MDNRTGGLLFARLQLRAPASRTFLLTAPGNETAVWRLASATAEAARRCARDVRLLRPDLSLVQIDSKIPSGDLAANARESSPKPQPCVDREAVQRALDGSDYVIAAADNLLESPSAMMLAACVDAVVVVVRRGKTMRSDLERLRLQMEQFGGIMISGVLLG